MLCLEEKIIRCRRDLSDDVLIKILKQHKISKRQKLRPLGIVYFDDQENKKTADRRPYTV